MANNDDIVEAGIDASDADRGADQFGRALDKMSNSMDQIIKLTEKVNIEAEESILVVNRQVDAYTTLQETYKRTAEEGEKLVRTVTNINEAARLRDEAKARNDAERAAASALRDRAKASEDASRAEQQRVRDVQNSLREDARNRAAILASMRADQERHVTSIINQLERERQNRANIYRAMKADEEALRQAQERRANSQASLGFAAGSGNLTARGIFAGVPGIPGGSGVGNFALGAGLGLGATAIDSSIRVLGDAIDEGRKSALEFNKQIGLILTISKDGADNTDTWSTALRGLSREFNVDEVEVARGAYQALSNQVIKSTKDTDFLSNALALAKTTNVELTTSVNAISSVVNSFGSKAGSTKEIADNLFRAVDLGNFQLGQIGDSLGRVTSLAAPLGISFKEVLASLDVVTIKGVKADEALSGLSNLYSELLKPSDALAAALRRLGFATAEQGIATLGYGRFLQTVIESSNKVGVSTAELFPNIRGLRDAFLEASDGGKKLQETLDSLGRSTGAVESGLRDVRAAAGEETKKALNDLKESASQVWTVFLRGSDEVIRRLRELRESGFGGRPGGEVIPNKPFNQFETSLREVDQAIAQAQSESDNELLEKLIQARKKLIIEAGKADEFGFGKGQKVGAEAVAEVRAEQDAKEALAKRETTLHQERLQKIAELKAKQEEASHIQSSNVEASTKEFLNNLDRRTAALQESLAKQRDVGGGDALSTALKLANDEQKKKLIEERVQQLKDIGLQDLQRAASLKGKDFIEDKSIEDAKKAADEVVKLRTQQRDEAISKLKPEERDAALKAVTEGKFFSLTGLSGSADDLVKAQQALTEAESERVQLEKQGLELLKQKGEEAKKQRDAAILDEQRFKASQALLDQGNAFQAGGALARADLAFGQSRQIDKLRLDALGVVGASLTQNLVGFGGDRPERRPGTFSQSVPIDVRNDEVITNIKQNTVAIKELTNEIVLFRNQRGVRGPRATANDVAGGIFDAARTVSGFLGFDQGGVVGTDFRAAGPTDTFGPVMLTPGERVLTPQQNRSYEAVLESALAGGIQSLNTKNHVTHVHGGINVTVRGGNTNQATAGELGRAIQREIRRGTIRLGG